MAYMHIKELAEVEQYHKGHGSNRKRREGVLRLTVGDETSIRGNNVKFVMTLLFVFHRVIDFALNLVSLHQRGISHISGLKYFIKVEKI